MIYEFVNEGLGIGIDVDIHSKKAISSEVNLIPIEDAIPWSVYVVYNNNKLDDIHMKSFLEMIGS